jgi:hypothetical protein
MGDMDVDVLAGSTVPMDRESQLEIMEKMIPFLSTAGVTPGSPPAKAFAREFLRLVGIMSLETVMDLIEQQPPTPPPKMMEIQAKVLAKQEETKVKIQGKQAEEAIKLQSMKEKHKMEMAKGMLDIQERRAENEGTIVHSILSQFRGNGEGNNNGQI